MVFKLMKADKLLHVLRKLNEAGELTITEMYALWKSSTFLQKWVPYLEQHGYIVCQELQWGSKKLKKCKLAEKGRKLMQLLEELEKLDQA